MSADFLGKRKERGIGLSAFESLRAEEEPWLGRCFVYPPEFSLMTRPRSTLIFGEVGSGKTALFLALRRVCVDRRSRLPVVWGPPPGDAPSPVFPLVERVFAACAEALLSHLSHHPKGFQEAPRDTQQTIAWFIYRHLGPDASRLVAAYADRADMAARPALHTLSSSYKENEWLASASPGQLIAEWNKVLRGIGLQGTWVLVGPDVDEESLPSIHALLSTQEVVDKPRFAFKMVLPMEFKHRLASAGGVLRKWVDGYTMTWTTADLQEIVLKRLSIAAGKEIAEFSEICDDPDLLQWLEGTGGSSPRGWLESIARLAAHYLKRQRPITIQEWHRIRASSPPPLLFDETTGAVTVGWRRIPSLSPVSAALMKYLYTHRDRVCTREELYYLAYLPACYPDAAGGDRDTTRAESRSVLDNAVSRLRKEVEPCPRHPIYIVTVRGKGYRLEHAW